MVQRMFRSVAVLALFVTVQPAGAQGASCQASSGAAVPTVVELYTSEGCDSCPPADRWLSSLKTRPGVLAAAFHVDYWDRLGWKDRFASPAATQRQARGAAQAGARFSYTPQVLVNGRDWRAWPDLPAVAPRAAPVQAVLQRVDGEVQVQVSAATPGAPRRLALWWAVLQDGLVSEVKTGENAGATLRHDRVALHFGEVTPWLADQPQALRLGPSALPGGAGQRLLVVVTDAATGQPVQALQWPC